MILALTLSPFLAGASAGSGSALVLRISVYAPLQTDSPVRIVGFEHDAREIQFELSNETEKSVVGIVMGNVSMAPPGCAADGSETRSTGGLRFQTRIAPHGRGTASRNDAHYPMQLVHSAESLAAGYLQTQFGVIGVYFEDGTTWPAQWPAWGLGNRPDPFDSQLVQSETGKCADVAAVAKALESVQEVVFDRQIPTVPSKGDDAVAVPHLRFSCSLEGPKAVCRLPLESNLSAPHPQPEASER